jgi:hypothetical protein
VLYLYFVVIFLQWHSWQIFFATSQLYNPEP